ncbi:MAG: GIY-YIG nuclease family protein [Snowella sp.]
MKQLSLFDESRPYNVRRPQSLVMDREALVKWKQRIFEYQQSAREQKQPQQQALFDLPRQTCHTPNEIDPFALRQHPADFYRLPQSPEPLDDTNQGCIYFIIDRSLPILLYIGETKLSAQQRWLGVHDAKDYLMRYIERHRQYELDVLPCSAFWYHVPPKKQILREWERQLIYRWRSPFNREMWDVWGQPFGKSA